MIVVIFCSVKICFNLTWISSLKLWSTFDKGSSNNNKSGLDNKDLAKEALCASPELIWCGNLSTTWSMWRNLIISFTFNPFFFFLFLSAERNKKKKKGLNVNEIIKFLHIDHVVDKFPHQISSGEAQRASLARSLLSNPDLLLLDEPLSNVDQSFKEEIQVKLKQILTEQKITTIIVTHDSYEAFYLGIPK